MSAAGASGRATGAADAGNPLRGEGFEPTPAFDITNPDRQPPSRADVINGILNLNEGRGGSPGVSVPVDAGSADGGDAG